MKKLVFPGSGPYHYASIDGAGIEMEVLEHFGGLQLAEDLPV